MHVLDRKGAIVGSESTQVAIVTAAGKGIGAGCARALALAGYRVVLQSASGGAVALAEELGGVGLRGSFTREDDLRAVVDLAVERFGRIDAVINNAGHVAKGDLLSLTDADWSGGVEMLLLPVIRMARLVTPVMEAQGGGAIVNLSAFGAREPALAYPVSSVVRAGLGAFTRLYAERYAAVGIRMNAVLPGMVDNYPVAPERLATIPRGAPVRVEEVAATVRFLVSSGASGITGQQVLVDAGMVRSP